MNPAKIDILHMILNAGLMVQFVLLLLLFFSATSWAIMIMKYRYIKTAVSESSEFIDFFWKSRNLSNAFSKAKMLQGSPVARIFRVGYVELKKSGRFNEPAESGSVNPSETQGASLGSRFTGIGNVKRAMRRAINAETLRMTRMLPFLATTGNTTPFIGLFGTVWGIMNSFHGIGLRGSASLAVVAPGISEALIATAAGLAAAIPAVIAFNHFMQKIRIVESELQNFAADFLNIIERDIIT
ncbi:MAG: MotA/TolQ/ExbB proton channel family protein [Desulfobacterales bacterium]